MTAPVIPGSDKNEQFIHKKVATYLSRLLTAYSIMENQTLEMLRLILHEDMGDLAHFIFGLMNKREENQFEESDQECLQSAEVISHTLSRILPQFNRGRISRVVTFSLRLLEQRSRQFRYRGRSEIEKKLEALKEMFSLTELEIEFCTFLFIISAWRPGEEYFIDYLACQTIPGRKYLTTLLQMNSKDINDILNGTLSRIGLFCIDKSRFELQDEFLDFFIKSSDKNLSSGFFTPIRRKAIPLEYHPVEKKQTDHVMALLKNKPETSTHLLLYGPPGTGKTSYAHGLAQRLKLPAYEIVRDQENTSSKRRAAIIACLNMTNTGEGSLIIVDEADNLLNTSCSWFMRGETQDKGWLNHLMEEPGARMIWITNSIDNIEESVLRRFSFSLHFKRFNLQQRIQVWNSALQENRVRRLLSGKDREELAKRYKVSAGAIDLAIKDARKTGTKSGESFQHVVTLALDAHSALLNGGEKPRDKDRIEMNYSLEGLNVQGDIQAMMERLEKFDGWLRQAETGMRMNMNLLFYGPPGTGKSELARFIAGHLGREIIRKRASDILDKWVGSTEQKIKEAFEEAEREEAILVIDEVDTFLFARGQAQHSWEISFTNEFLTQMERFRGILVCTTNRLEGLDEASIRRFNHKVGFDYLTPEGNVIFYCKLLSPLLKVPFDERTEKSLRDITSLAPGDFKVVRDRQSFERPEQLNNTALIQALQEESQVKRMQRGEKKIGF